MIEVRDPDENLTFMEESELPETPVKRSDPLQRLSGVSHLDAGNSAFTVTRTADVWRIECTFGKIQPQDTARVSDDLHVGASVSMELALELRIFADNLSRPATALCQLRFAAEAHEVSVEEIENMDFKRFVEAREALG